MLSDVPFPPREELQDSPSLTLPFTDTCSSNRSVARRLCEMEEATCTEQRATPFLGISNASQHGAGSFGLMALCIGQIRPSARLIKAAHATRTAAAASKFHKPADLLS
jgi:hypothetical protein